MDFPEDPLLLGNSVMQHMREALGQVEGLPFDEAQKIWDDYWAKHPDIKINGEKPVLIGRPMSRAERRALKRKKS